MNKNVKAWVMFSGKTEIWWLKFLKPGFRHCYVLMNDGVRWVTVDPLSPHTEILVHHHISPDFDLVGWFRLRGQMAAPAMIDWDKKKPAPFMLFSCVEAVKRILGLHERKILTPWQLYNHLAKQPTQYQGELEWAQ